MTGVLRFRKISFLGLWLFAAVTLLSIALQNVVFVGSVDDNSASIPIGFDFPF